MRESCRQGLFAGLFTRFPGGPDGPGSPVGPGDPWRQRKNTGRGTQGRSDRRTTSGCACSVPAGPGPPLSSSGSQGKTPCPELRAGWGTLAPGLRFVTFSTSAFPPRSNCSGYEWPPTPPLHTSPGRGRAPGHESRSRVPAQRAGASHISGTWLGANLNAALPACTRGPGGPAATCPVGAVGVRETGEDPGAVPEEGEAHPGEAHWGQVQTGHLGRKRCFRNSVSGVRGKSSVIAARGAEPLGGEAPTRQGRPP